MHNSTGVNNKENFVADAKDNKRRRKSSDRISQSINTQR